MRHTRHFFVWLPILVVVLLLASLALFTKPASAAGEFITTWQTDISDPSDASLTIQAFGNAIYDYTIDWGDGTVENNVTGTASHTYSSPGTYNVAISGTYPRIHLNYHPDAKKLVSVDAWGDNQWSSMREAFAGASNVVIAATDQPDLSAATSLQSMFSGATNLSGNLSSWDVSTIVNFSYMFQSATVFDEDITSWDMSYALNLEGMFYLASSFNQTITDWVVSRATNFSSMFRGASSFDQALNWDTSNMQQSRFMFQEATDFDQDLGDWNVSNLQQADSMFSASALSSANYDALLVGWLLSAAQNNVPLTNTDVGYCQSGEALLALETSLDWEITNAGFDGSACGPTDVEIINVTDPSVDENVAGSVIGTLQAIDVEQNQSYTYSIGCSQQTFADNTYFSVVGDELVTASDLDFENPSDENGDNVYEICVTVEDGDGFTVQKIFNITVTDTDEPVSNDAQDDTDDTDTVSVTGGAVLGASTTGGASDDASSDDAQVLAETDENSEVLAETGQNVVFGVIVGLALVSLSLFIMKISLPARFTLKR